MENRLDVYFSKVFCRTRHKTQLFSGEIDDHYHTRLQHTLEVEEIALSIAKQLNATNPDMECDLKKVSLISLLHDIGHTPFGHAGERGLHDILSGKDCEKYGLPDFRKLGIAIGFKHNINSGLLYSENCRFDRIDSDILDGIVKHSKLRYCEDGLDYGFEYIFHGYSNSYAESSKTVEGFIVANADEIAQICSDYIDLCLGTQSGTSTIKNNVTISKHIGTFSDDERTNAKEICDCLTSAFIASFCKQKKSCNFDNNEFSIIVKELKDAISEYVKNNNDIKEYDLKHEDKIKALFAFYYKKPEELTNDFFGDFVYRAKRIHYRKATISILIKDTLASDRDEVKKIIDWIYKEITKSDKFLSVNTRSDYQTILRLYNRSLAVHISKMTDNFAEHKYKKYLDTTK